MLEENRAVPGRSQALQDGVMDMPEGIRGVIGRRLNRLSGQCNLILATAAVIGRVFSLPILKGLLGDRSENEILDLLEEALVAGVAVESSSTRGDYQFSHVLIQQTLVEEISVARRSRIHGRIAKLLEERYGEKSEEHAPEIVEHLSRAGMGAKKLAPYLLAAGDQALSQHAYEQALEYFERGLEGKEGIAEDEETAALLYGLARAQAATLKESDFSTFRAAFDFYEKNGRADRAVAVATIPLCCTSERTELGELCRRGLALVERGSLQAAQLLAKLGVVEYHASAHYAAAKRCFEEAESIAKREHNLPLQTRIMVYWSQVEWFSENQEALLERSQAALRLAELTGDLRARVEAMHATQVYLQRGGKSGQVRAPRPRPFAGGRKAAGQAPAYGSLSHQSDGREGQGQLAGSPQILRQVPGPGQRGASC